MGAPLGSEVMLGLGHPRDMGAFDPGMEVNQVPVSTLGPGHLERPANFSSGEVSSAHAVGATAARDEVMGGLAQLRQEVHATALVTGAQPHAPGGEAELLPADAETAIGELCNSFRVLSEALSDLQREVSAHKIVAKQQGRKWEEAINSIGNELAEFRERSSTQAAAMNLSKNFDRFQSSLVALTDRVNILEQSEQGASTVRDIRQSHKPCEPDAALAEKVAQLCTVVDDLRGGQAELGQDIGDIVGVLSHSNVISGTLGLRGQGGGAPDVPTGTSTGGTAAANASFGSNLTSLSGQMQELRRTLGEHGHEHAVGFAEGGRAAQQIRELVEMVDMERKARTSEVEELRTSILTIARGASSGKGGLEDNATELPAALVALHMALAKELRNRAETSEAATSALRAEVRAELSQYLTTFESVVLRVVSMAESVRSDGFMDRDMRRSPAGESKGGGFDVRLTQGGLATGSGATESSFAGTPMNGAATPSISGAATPVLCGRGGNPLTAGACAGGRSATAARMVTPMVTSAAGSEAVTSVGHVSDRCPQNDIFAQSRVSRSAAFTSRAPTPPFSSNAAAPSIGFNALPSPAMSQEAGWLGSGAATSGRVVPPACLPGVLRSESMRSSSPLPCGF